eukprot:6414735-Amphidinium_carterae.1
MGTFMAVSFDLFARCFSTTRCRSSTALFRWPPALLPTATFDKTSHLSGASVMYRPSPPMPKPGFAMLVVSPFEVLRNCALRALTMLS